MTGVVTVIGIGEDGLAGLGAAARDAVESAELLVGGNRHLAFVPERAGQARLPWGKDIAGAIERIAADKDTTRVVVLASGDPLQHGIAAKLIARLGADAVRVVPTAGAFALAAAQMGWPLEDPMLACISVHALPFPALIPLIAPEARLLILSRTGATPREVASLLVERGYGASALSVLECMGGPREKRTYGLATDAWTQAFDNLNVIAVTCVAGADALRQSRAAGLPDDAFEHDGNITKREVRAVTLAALGPLPGETLWDLGAGNGTVAVEWLRLCPAAHAVAVERDADRVQRIMSNALGLGVPGLVVIEGDMADVIGSLDDPDAVFLGGGIAEAPEVIDICMTRLSAAGRLVANAVTLDAQAVLQKAHAAHGGELVRIAVSRAEPLGGFQTMKAAIDVLQWRWRKP